MHTNFWHQRWQDKQIGFHLSEANPLLVKYFDNLDLKKGSAVFIPLCGKTLDIAWLFSQGYRVAGAELSEIAIKKLFEELGVAPEVKSEAKFKVYSAEGIKVFAGDIFDLNSNDLGEIDAVYDRAALVALPQEIRVRYTEHIVNITNVVQQLLISFDYNQELMAGPPFSVNGEEIKKHYSKSYDVKLLESATINLKGQCEAKEEVWLLRK